MSEFSPFDGGVAHSFALEVDGVRIEAITEVSGLKMEQDVIQLKQNTPDGKCVIKNLPGRPKPGEVTLTRALTHSNSFEEWVNAAHFGKVADCRKNGAIIVFDFEQKPVKRYTITNAWPKSLEIGSMKAADTNVLTEKLTITYETMEPGGA